MKNHKKNKVVWFTGLSASGKTTLSERLYQDLKDLGLNLPISIINESFNMLPSCTSGSNQNLNKMEKQNFEDFCKKSTLGSLDEDVALLCLDKLS